MEHVVTVKKDLVRPPSTLAAIQARPHSRGGPRATRRVASALSSLCYMDFTARCAFSTDTALYDPSLLLV